MADNIGRHVNRYRPFLSPEETIFFAKPRFELADAGDGLRLTREPFEHLDDYFGPNFDTELPSLARDDPSYEPSWYRSTLIDTWRTARVLRTVRVLREARAPRWRRLYEDGNVVELTRRIVADFVAAVRADGRQAIVVFFPDRTFLEDALAGREHLAVPLLRRLATEGVDVVDTTSALADFVREGHPLSEQLIPHYSAAMNARVAERLAARLRELPVSRLTDQLSPDGGACPLLEARCHDLGDALLCPRVRVVIVTARPQRAGVEAPEDRQQIQHRDTELLAGLDHQTLFGGVRVFSVELNEHGPNDDEQDHALLPGEALHLAKIRLSGLPALRQVGRARRRLNETLLPQGSVLFPIRVQELHEVEALDEAVERAAKRAGGPNSAWTGAPAKFSVTPTITRSGSSPIPCSRSNASSCPLL